MSFQFDSNYQDLARSDVISAIESLDEDGRVVLLLAALAGFTCKEIATMLKLPIGTVRSRLSRGRAQIRDARAGRLAGTAHEVHSLAAIHQYAR